MRKRRIVAIQPKSLEPCFFCMDKITPNYKDVATLKRFLTTKQKIVPRRGSGVCARHQRQLANAVKRARHIALI